MGCQPGQAKPGDDHGERLVGQGAENQENTGPNLPEHAMKLAITSTIGGLAGNVYAEDAQTVVDHAIEQRFFSERPDSDLIMLGNQIVNA